MATAFLAMALWVSPLAHAQAQSLVDRVAALEAAVAAQATQIASVQSALAAETAARQAADTALQAALSNESAAREAAVAAVAVEIADLQSALAVETAARQTADTALQTAITNESAARAAANAAEAAARQAAIDAALTAAALSTEASDRVDVPTSSTGILSLDVPAGKYVVIANVVVSNQSLPQTTLPVICVLRSPSERSVFYGARIDPFDSATGQGASSATIALTLTTELFSDGTLILDCLTNTGPGGQTVFATSRQITAISVGNLTELDPAP